MSIIIRSKSRLLQTTSLVAFSGGSHRRRMLLRFEQGNVIVLLNLCLPIIYQGSEVDF